MDGHELPSYLPSPIVTPYFLKSSPSSVPRIAPRHMSGSKKTICSGLWTAQVGNTKTIIAIDMVHSRDSTVKSHHSATWILIERYTTIAAIGATVLWLLPRYTNFFHTLP
jgi:hypothetical protein